MIARRRYRERAGVSCWLDKLTAHFGVNEDGLCKLPVIIVGNKFDRVIKDRPKRPAGIDNYYLYLVSALSNYNYEKPFLWLSRKLRNDDNLEFVVWPAIEPPEITVDDELAADQQAALTEADELEEEEPDY